MVPGEYILKEEKIAINQGLAVKKITVVNQGDRPIQVGSHFHFFEVNRFLKFSREEALGYRLDIPSGTAVRFEPDMEKEVDLVAIAGNRIIKGFNNLADVQVNETTKKECLEKAARKNFL